MAIFRIALKTIRAFFGIKTEGGWVNGLVKIVLTTIKRWVMAIFRIALKTIKAFFDIKTEDRTADRSAKIALTAVRRGVFTLLDYWVAFVLGTMVAALKYHGFSYWEIFCAVAVYDIIAAYAFYQIQIKSGQDITLGEALRRAADVIKNENRLSGYVTFFLITVKAIVWEGPEQIVIFFKITGRWKVNIALLILSLIQALFGAWLYSLGYDSVAELFQ